jgi:hypothetical protein
MSMNAQTEDQSKLPPNYSNTNSEHCTDSQTAFRNRDTSDADLQALIEYARLGNQSSDVFVSFNF